MRRAFKYRLYPNRDQERELGAMLETHRRLYNDCLGQRRLAYGDYKLSIGYCDQSGWFKAERRSNPYYARLNFGSAQATMRRLDGAYQRFFKDLKLGRKTGYPRFKAQDRFTSFCFPSYGDGCRLKDGRLRVQHVGMVKVKLHRPLEGEVKTVAVKREGDKWYAVFSCDLGDVALPQHAGPAVGLDMGLTHFVTTSDGEMIENPRYLKAELPELRRLGRAVSRKKKGGRNRRKAAKRLAKLHARIADLRREHHHKLAHRLAARYGIIAVEGLNVKAMLGNRRLSRAIQDAGWAGFLGIQRHQAEKAGARYVEAEAGGSSQDCSGCGERVPKGLRERRHHCPRCGLDLDRDLNAARNILARGLAKLARTGPAGVNERSLSFVA